MNLKSISLSAAALLMVACAPTAPAPAGLTAEAFGTATVDGAEVSLYTLRNANGMVAQFTNLGAKLVALYVPDRNGTLADVVLGYPTAAQYAECDNAAGKGEPFFGATIGRYGNRIAGGVFALGDTTYQLSVNEKGVNHLHGGSKGFYSVVWTAQQRDNSSIEFTYISPDGEMGYPGTLSVSLTYTLTDANELRLDYAATTDKPTVVNLTHHSFFNLAGEDAPTINDHSIAIYADNITPVDGNLIPTGELMPVDGTPFDFRTLRCIGDSLQSAHEQMALGGGYDHNWVLSADADSLGLRLAATVEHEATGRVMQVLTTEPGLQFYGGNFIDGSQVGKCGKAYPYRSAFCLETQHFPDSPNHSNFPSTVLNPGEQYAHTCIYRFGTK